MLPDQATEDEIVRRKQNQEDQALPSLALVFGYIAIKDLESTSDQIDVLDRLGYGNLEIARICGTTPGSVRTRKSESKKRASRRRA